MNAYTARRRIHPASAAALALVPLALVAAACGANTAAPTTSASGGATTTAPPARVRAAAVVKAASVAKLGSVLVDAKGFTLYTYSPDPKGKSVCTGGCATVWPPLMVTSASTTIASGMSGFSVIHRSGGGLQVAYHGKPLYTYSGDSSAGTANGQGIGGTWFAVKVGGGSASGSGTTTSSSSGGGNGY
jgi:predicted lipoprotein with Yx(FWY)xxD motif